MNCLEAWKWSFEESNRWKKRTLGLMMEQIVNKTRKEENRDEIGDWI